MSSLLKTKKNATGITIRFAISKCSLGLVLVAASEKGICAVLLGDDAKALAANLADRFPQVRLVDADLDLKRKIEAIIALIEAPGRSLDLALDLQGTDFQKSVWQALREIPLGSTASYSEVARALGIPQAVRSVARACAANPVAVVIPCHRVLRADGHLSGYRWGVERKRALLKREMPTG